MPNRPLITHVYASCKNQSNDGTYKSVYCQWSPASTNVTSRATPEPLDLPIDIRKGKRAYTHPISSIVTCECVSLFFYSSHIFIWDFCSKNVDEAMSHIGWQSAMEDEVLALLWNDTRSLVSPPARNSVVGFWWVLSVKLGGSIKTKTCCQGIYINV